MKMGSLPTLEAADYFEGLMEGFVAYDAQWRTLYMNAAAERLLGRRREEVLGRKWHEAFPHAVGNAVDSMYQAVMRERVAQRIELFYPHYGRWFEISANPVASGGIAVYFRDSSERKHAEQALREREAQLRFVTDHAPVLIVHCDANATYKFVNIPYAERFGLRPEQIVGKRIAEIVGLEAYERFRCHVDAALRGERVEFEERVPYEKIGPTWMHCVYVPQREADGEVSGFMAVVQDITRRKQAEAALRQSEERFSKAFGASPDGLVISTQSDGLIREVNESFLELLGLQREEVIGRRSTELNLYADPNDRERALALFRQQGRLRNHELSMRARSGEMRTALISTESIDVAGEPSLLTLVRDISERKQIEEALRKSESRFRGLMEQAPFSVQLFSPDGKTIGANRAWSKLWGATLAETAGYNVLHDPQLEAKGVLAYLRRAFAGEAVAIPAVEYDPRQVIPGRAWHEDPVRWVSAVAYPLKDDAGRVREVVLVHEDITARRRAESALRESEEKLRLLADTIPQLAWMARADGDVFWYNRRWYEYTGTTAQDMAGEGWQSVHDPRVLPEVLGRWKRSIARGEPFEMVFPLKGADRQFRPFLTRVNPLRDAQGRVVYWCGTNTDISEMKRMEEALRDADRRKDEFFATLAHELRNPLAPALNVVEVLKRAEPAPQVSFAVGVLERQIKQLARLVDDLVDVSRITRGLVSLRREPVALRDVVRQAVEATRAAAEAQGHELAVEEPPPDLRVEGDATRLTQVLVNLIGNAVKFTPAGGRITLVALAEGEEAVMRVRDNGLGIEAELMPSIFQPFVQGPQSLERSAGGLGIGLALVKSLVDLHGGRVSVYSAGQGRGSEFVVRLPRSTYASPTVAARQEESPACPRRRVLVVDDNVDAAKSAAMLLRVAGHEVAEAYDGREALELAQKFRPQVVLLDLGLPEMDGFAVARALRASAGGAQLLLIALTGYGRELDRVASSEAGFDLHLTKPVAFETLAACLQKAG